MPTFSPTNLTFHLDPSIAGDVWQDTAMTTPAGDGDPVGAINDVGDAVDAAIFQTSTNRPTYRTTGINNLGAEDYDGSNDSMLCYNDAFVTSRPISMFITNAAYTVFVALMLDGNGSNAANIYQDQAVFCDLGQFWGLHYKTVAGISSLVGYNWDGSAKTVSQVVTQGIPIVAALRFDGADIFLSVNGGSENSSASGNITNVGGQLAFGPQAFNGKEGERLFYNINQTGTPYTDTYQYMLDRWVNAPASSSFPALGVAIL